MTKRECDAYWDKFDFKSIDKAKEILTGLSGTYKYKLYKEIKGGEFEI